MFKNSCQTETWTKEESQMQYKKKAFEFEIGIRELIGWIINLFD